MAAGCSAACQAVHGGDASPSSSDPGISSSAADAPEADAAGSTLQHSWTPARIRREFVINKRSFASKLTQFFYPLPFIYLALNKKLRRLIWACFTGAADETK